MEQINCLITNNEKFYDVREGDRTILTVQVRNYYCLYRKFSAYAGERLVYGWTWDCLNRMQIWHNDLEGPVRVDTIDSPYMVYREETLLQLMTPRSERYPLRRDEIVVGEAGPTDVRVPQLYDDGTQYIILRDGYELELDADHRPFLICFVLLLLMAVTPMQG